MGELIDWVVGGCICTCYYVSSCERKCCSTSPFHKKAQRPCSAPLLDCGNAPLFMPAIVWRPGPAMAIRFLMRHVR